MKVGVRNMISEEKPTKILSGDAPCNAITKRQDVKSLSHGEHTLNGFLQDSIMD